MLFNIGSHFCRIRKHFRESHVPEPDLRLASINAHQRIGHLRSHVTGVNTKRTMVGGRWMYEA